MYDKIKDLSNKYAINLKEKMDIRTHEMYDDDNAHYLIYKVLGISSE